LRYHDDDVFNLAFYTTISPNVEQQHQFLLGYYSVILKNSAYPAVLWRLKQTYMPCSTHLNWRCRRKENKKSLLFWVKTGPREMGEIKIF